MDEPTASRYRRNDKITDCGILSRSDSRTRARFANQRFNATRLNDGNERQPACSTATRPPFSINCAYFAALALSFAVNAANAQTQYPFFAYDNPSNPSAPHCHDQAKVLAALKENGLLEIAAGKRIFGGDPYNIVVMNTKGRMYNFEQQRINNAPPQLCLRFKAVNGIVDDSSTRPAWTRNIGVNGTLNPDGMYTKGGRIWAGGHAFSVASDGREVPGKLVAIATAGLIRDNNYEAGAVWSIDSKGVPKTIVDLKDVKINMTNISYLMDNGLRPSAQAPSTK